MSKRQTPKEKLLAEKERIRKECERLERGFNEDLIYIQENIGSIALSSVKSMIFPSSKQKEDKQHIATKGIAQNAVRGGIENTSERIDYLGIVKEMFPFAWDIAKPFIITWAVRKAQLLMRKAFSSKKRKK